MNYINKESITSPTDSQSNYRNSCSLLLLLAAAAAAAAAATAAGRLCIRSTRRDH